MAGEKSIGALWSKTKNGNEYFTGSITIDGEKINIVVFGNKYKQEERHPDYNIFLSRPKGESNRSGSGEPF